MALAVNQQNLDFTIKHRKSKHTSLFMEKPNMFSKLQ